MTLHRTVSAFCLLPFAFRRALAVAAILAAASPAVAAAPDESIAFDRATAMWLVTFPLACVDKLHDPPKGSGYVYETAATLKPGFQKARAFYGCFDWHSSVNSTWT